MNSIELRSEEKQLLGQIDFNPASLERHEARYWIAVGEAALRLTKSLIARSPRGNRLQSGSQVPVSGQRFFPSMKHGYQPASIHQ